MTVKITYLSKSNYTVYNGMYNGQTLYVIWDGDKLFARYGLESSPEALNVINSEAFVWQVNELLTIPAVNQLMDDILPYINQLSELSGTNWNGYQWIGEFDDEEKANELLDKIDNFIEVDNEELPHFDIVTPEYYNTIFISKTPADMRSYISGKKYLDEGILFSEDPYKFVNFAIGMNASVADEYVGAIYNMFSQYMEFVSTLEDSEYNNDQNSKSMMSMYDSAITYYYDIIAEPDKHSYVDMIVYGNQYFTSCYNIFSTDELLSNEELMDLCDSYIVEIDDNLVKSDLTKDSTDVDDLQTEETDETDEINELDSESREPLEFEENGTSENSEESSAESSISDNYALNPNNNSSTMISEHSQPSETPDEENNGLLVDDSYWRKDSGARAI